MFLYISLLYQWLQKRLGRRIVHSSADGNSQTPARLSLYQHISTYRKGFFKMRKIEQQMMRAVENNRTWAAGNTSVSRDADNPNMMVVSLHGNHIASIEIADGRILGRWINLKTLDDYPTMTTLSRLRAMGFRVRKAKGRVIIGVVRPDEGNLVAEYVLEKAFEINKGKPMLNTETA